MAMSIPLKIAAISAGVAIFALLFGWAIFPAVLKAMLKKEKALTLKTDTRIMWEKIPFAFDFKIYFFNYTNPEEIMKGGIPIVNEVGPYYFEEWKEKADIEDHEDGTITYKILDKFYFRSQLSAPGLTGEEVLTIPHIFMLGTIAKINQERPAMLSLVAKALNAIYNNPEDLFMRAKVLDILFRGVIIDCSKTEFAPKALCSQILKDLPNGMTLEPNNQVRFSLFGTKNNTIESNVITVRNGKRNIMEVGKVIAIDGESQQKIWRDSCNDFVGTDGTILPPFLQRTDTLDSYAFTLCRPFRPWFEKKIKYNGIKANRYICNMGDLANDPQLNCYCDAPDQCPPKGVMDLSKCMEAPILASLPHFYDSDPKLLEAVQGLTPDKEQHGIFIDFEPLSGTAMVVRKRLQLNMNLIQTDKYELCKHVKNTLIPIFWLEEGFALNKTYINMLKYQLFVPKNVVNVVSWWLLSFGICGTVISIVFHYRENIMKMAQSGEKVTKITPVQRESAEGNDDDEKNISVIGKPQEPPKIDA